MSSPPHAPNPILAGVKSKVHTRRVEPLPCPSEVLSALPSKQKIHFRGSEPENESLTDCTFSTHGLEFLNPHIPRCPDFRLSPPSEMLSLSISPSYTPLPPASGLLLEPHAFTTPPLCPRNLSPLRPPALLSTLGSSEPPAFSISFTTVSVCR